MNKTIRIRNGTIITMDRDREIIHDGELIIFGDKIVEVGEKGKLSKKYQIDIDIDASDKVVLPGFINCHSHTWFNLFRNLKDDIPITELLPKYIFPINDDIRDEEIYIGSQLALIEMILSGTTCFLDNPPILEGRDPIEQTSRVIENLGIKGILAPGTWGSGEIKQEVKWYRDVIEKWHGKSDGRILIWPSLQEPWPPEVAGALSNIAEEYNIGITIHMAEASDDVLYTLNKYGKRHVDLLHDAGVLSPRFVGSHAIWLVDHELELLAQSESKIVYAPGSVMSQGGGVAPIVKMLKLGIMVGLGSNGAAFNVDMIEEMRLAALIQKGCNLDSACMTAEKVLEMATIKAAEVLMLDHLIGSIEKDKKADVIIVNLKKPHTVPRHDVIQSLVYGGRGQDVETVIIDGRIIMKDREIKGFDVERIVAEAERTGLAIVKRVCG